MNHQDDDILQSLRCGPEPPESLEERTLEALLSRGLVRTRRRMARSTWLAGALAAAGLLFVSGIVVGRLVFSPAAPAEVPTFALLLHQPAGFDPLTGPVTSGDPMRRVREYTEWARSGAQGAVIGGKKLKDVGRILRRDAGGLVSVETDPTVPSEPGWLGGYFLIRASDIDEAERIAATSPHLDYGGTIELRQVDLE